MLRSRASMLCNDAFGLCLSTRAFPRAPSLVYAVEPKRPLGCLHPRIRISRVLPAFMMRTTSPLKKKFTSASANSSSTVSPSLTDSEILPGSYDDYGGVVVEMNGAPLSSERFLSLLRASILLWSQQEGFWYHHAEPSYLMLVYWIPASEHTLPVNATHRVGVGALVINQKREVLAVQEKKLHGTSFWKLPTGVVEQGEDIFSGAVREVKEETGIDAEFLEVLVFRQSHVSFFEKSDLFFVCLMKPLSSDIQMQESEIEAAQWMPIEEFASQPIVHKHELLKHIVDVGLARLEKGYSGFAPLSISSAFSNKQSSLYLNSKYLSNRSP